MYQRKTRGWSQHLDFMALDIAALEISLLSSFLTHVGFSNMIGRRMFWGSFIFLPFLDLAIMVVTDTYHNVIRRNHYQELGKMLNQTTYLALIFGAFLSMNRKFSFAPPQGGPSITAKRSGSFSQNSRTISIVASSEPSS